MQHQLVDLIPESQEGTPPFHARLSVNGYRGTGCAGDRLGTLIFANRMGRQALSVVGYQLSVIGDSVRFPGSPSLSPS